MRRFPFGGRSVQPTTPSAASMPQRATLRGPDAVSPILPMIVERSVQAAPQRLQRLLPPLPDDIDLGVVGDRLQGDMRHPLIDETLANIVVGWCVFGGQAAGLTFLPLPLGAIGQQVIRIASPHNP